MFNHKFILLVFASLVGLSGAATTLAAPPWAEQGPGPILNGQDEGIPNNPVSGAINAIVPITADTVFVGTVNGGVWRTSNATAATPTWTPLTDTQLPALSINSLAVSPVNANTLFAGTGSTSSFGFLGSPGFGVARSIDGGTTWTVLNNPPNIFTGRRIDSVVPTTLGGGNVVLAATLFDGGGVYRSIDNGSTFARISGNGTSGLPNAGVSQLIADPGNTSRFYAGVPQNFLVSGTAGVYRSDDGGVTWTLVNGSGGTALTGLANSLRILLSVNASNSVVYADIINTGGNLNGVFRSTNLGGAWTSLGTPAPSIYPGNQGNIHGALAADPANQNVVFIAGDRQDNNGASASGFPNTNGCNNFSGNVFRWTGTAWELAVCNGANGTSPHADSRDMQFDANGNLLQANDGGIFRLVSPNSAGNRVWAAVVGNIRPNELHSAAFDPVSKVVFGGAQDTGTPIQSTPGSFTWNELDQGDGGVVAVNGQTALPNSLRYTTRPNFGCTRNPGDPSAQNVPVFFRTTWTAANVRLDGFPLVGLNVVGTGQNLCQFDANIQFYNPYVLNVVDPTRMLIGTQNIYESLNQGDSLTNLGAAGGQVGDNFSYGQPIAYGGRLSGTNFPAVFYVGAGATIRHRVSGSIVTLAAYPGATVRTIVMNPQNYQQVFVSNSNNRVWGSFNEGASWIDLTADLSPAGSISPSLTSQVGTIEIFSPDQTLKNMVLIAGGFGAFQMRRPAGGGSIWTPLSTGIPNALVQDLHYDYTNDVLVAGSLGRGAWTLSSFFRGGGGTGAVAAASGAPSPLIPLLDLPPAPPIANMSAPGHLEAPQQDDWRATMSRRTFAISAVILLGAALALGAGRPAPAAPFTINFETLPSLPTQPNNFAAAGPMQTYSAAGMFSISGGVVLGNPTFLASFPAHGTPPNTYGTADFADPSLLDTITLTFPIAEDVVSLTGVLFNGQPLAENYVVDAFSGATLVDFNTFNGMAGASSASGFGDFSLSAGAAQPITSVTITTPNATANGWDFFVDTITVTPAAVTTIPEPSTALILLSGAVGLWMVP